MPLMESIVLMGITIELCTERRIYSQSNTQHSSYLLKPLKLKSLKRKSHLRHCTHFRSMHTRRQAHTLALLMLF
ncbi:hypothetical protein GDO81_029316 [Engystomops pustulosus]|uniref:Uncharacterized protein n=1 Tax=Engystomops pustulosus TaxID=76066 RepID=A0AAV6YEH4_ENGPU|nr:hypothetical protein GDO81_029316 [Engystomops pustulosus]